MILAVVCFAVGFVVLSAGAGIVLYWAFMQVMQGVERALSRATL